MRIKVTKVQNFIFIPEIYTLGFDSELWGLLTQGFNFRSIFEGLKMKKYRFKKSKSRKRIQWGNERIGQVRHFPRTLRMSQSLICKGYKFKTRVPKVTITVIMVIIRASSLSISTSKRLFTKLDRVVFLHVMGFGWVSWTNGNRLNRMEKDWRKRENQRNGQRFFLSLKEEETERKRKKLRERLGKRSAWTH